MLWLENFEVAEQSKAFQTSVNKLHPFHNFNELFLSTSREMWLRTTSESSTNASGLSKAHQTRLLEGVNIPYNLNEECEEWR